MAIIFITHDLGVVSDICDKIIVMKKGRISGVLDAKKTTVAEIKKYSVSSVEV